MTEVESKVSQPEVFGSCRSIRYGRQILPDKDFASGESQDPRSGSAAINIPTTVGGIHKTRIRFNSPSVCFTGDGDSNTSQSCRGLESSDMSTVQLQKCNWNYNEICTLSVTNPNHTKNLRSSARHTFTIHHRWRQTGLCLDLSNDQFLFGFSRHDQVVLVLILSQWQSFLRTILFFATSSNVWKSTLRWRSPDETKWEWQTGSRGSVFQESRCWHPIFLESGDEKQRSAEKSSESAQSTK